MCASWTGSPSLFLGDTRCHCGFDKAESPVTEDCQRRNQDGAGDDDMVTLVTVTRCDHDPEPAASDETPERGGADDEHQAGPQPREDPRRRERKTHTEQ